MRLAPVRAADAGRFAAFVRAQRAFFAPYDPVRPEEFFTVEGQRRELEQAVAASAVGSRMRFVIEQDGEMIGWLSISNVVRGVFRSANLGYAVGQEHNGRGVGTRAVALAVQWAFGEGGLHRLEAGTLVDNRASQRVLEKNDFERIGLARDYLFIAGAWRDHVLFARTAPWVGYDG